MRFPRSFSTFERHTTDTAPYKLWVFMELRDCRKRPHVKCRKSIFESGVTGGQLIETTEGGLHRRQNKMR